MVRDAEPRTLSMRGTAQAAAVPGSGRRKVQLLLLPRHVTRSLAGTGRGRNCEMLRISRPARADCRGRRLLRKVGRVRLLKRALGNIDRQRPPAREIQG